MMAVAWRVWQGFEGSDSRSEWRRSSIVFLPRHRSVNDKSSVGISTWAGLCQRRGRNKTAPANYQRTPVKVL